eukprot:SAG31_NODE_5060_length_2766_cov_17.451444_3_plen_119_part_00
MNAHATSTPLGDSAEATAIACVFKDCSSEKLWVSSTKGAIGHLLGAAGAVEAAFSCLALHRQAIPPTANLVDPDPNTIRPLGLQLPATAVQFSTESDDSQRLEVALSNSFGFGGESSI